MAASTTDALFVTANVGSIFEDPTSMLKIWCNEFLAAVSRLSPKLVALHCQEVGGKNYERSMQHVSEFVKLLMSSEELQLFDKVKIFLDEDYSSAEHFTALGNFYFIHESLRDENIQIFNFQECRFESVAGKEVYSGNIEEVATKEKSKFPQETFPECKWSRKGFMRTRWNLNGTVFDLINIHLFHDASNFIAMESCPSVYCKNRQRALDHTLKRFHTDHYGIVPFFVFGDFNFRTDTQGVVKKLSEGLNAVKIQSNKSSDPAKLQFRDESSQKVVLTLGKKEFSHQDHQKLFVGDESEWLRAYDRELESFSGQLFEFTINFPPTYPYVEDSERGEMYMQTRCPSWCDRVFLSASARALVDDSVEGSTPEYGLIGLNSCMGDHKPVFLQASLIGGLGIYLQEESSEHVKTATDVITKSSNGSKTNLTSFEDKEISANDSVDLNDKICNSPNDCIIGCQVVREELDEAVIIKNHLDPVPFPEPYDLAPQFRYLLWNQTEFPIKVFKETPV